MSDEHEFQNAHHAWGVGEQTARDEARLFDACLALGMSHDEPSVSEWAARRAYRMTGGRA